MDWDETSVTHWGLAVKFPDGEQRLPMDERAAKLGHELASEGAWGLSVYRGDTWKMWLGDPIHARVSVWCSSPGNYIITAYEKQDGAPRSSVFVRAKDCGDLMVPLRALLRAHDAATAAFAAATQEA